MSHQQKSVEVGDNQSWCVVALKDMRQDSDISSDEVIKSVISNVWSKLNGECGISDVRDITVDDMAVMQNNFSDKSLGLDQKSMISNAIQNIQKQRPEVNNLELATVGGYHNRASALEL